MALDAAEFGILTELLAGQRWACLATGNSDGTPLASMVAFAPDPSSGALLLHLSTLARHTRNLLERPRVSLAISELDHGAPDPQTLARIALNGQVEVIDRDSGSHAGARAVYEARFPAAAERFEFGDFRLLSLELRDAHYVGGFARAFAVDAAALQRAVRLAGGATA